MASNPVKKGDTFGVMRCVSSVLADQSAVGSFMCMACYAVRSVTTDALKQEIVRDRTGGCLECNAVPSKLRSAYKNYKPRVPKPLRGPLLPRERKVRDHSSYRIVPVRSGERFGLMEATVDCPGSSVPTSFRCVVCDAERTISASILKAAIKNRLNTCLVCKEIGDNRVQRKPVPVTRGTKFGDWVSLKAAAASSQLVRYRCCKCKTVRRRSASWMRTQLNRFGFVPCAKCGPRSRPTKVVTDGNRYQRYRVSGVNCVHKKSLICIDPGGVQIMRCRLCDVVQVPAWKPPKVGNLFPRKALDDHPDEDDPGFENVVRVIEDCG